MALHEHEPMSNLDCRLCGSALVFCFRKNKWMTVFEYGQLVDHNHAPISKKNFDCVFCDEPLVDFGGFYMTESAAMPIK